MYGVVARGVWVGCVRGCAALGMREIVENLFAAQF